MKLLITLFFTITFFHGDNLATFTIIKTNDSIKITAKLDASDLEKAIGSKKFSTSNKDLENYLLNQMSYSVNNQETPFVVKAVKVNHHHVNIELLIHGKFDAISDIKIKNKLLFDVNDKQVNVIEIRFNGVNRDFLINKDTPILNINLD